jgi:hypothetical protein
LVRILHLHWANFVTEECFPLDSTCENPAAPRKCQMALRFFLVTQTSFEEGATQTHGDFLIDTPFSTQGKILESLNDDDAKQTESDSGSFLTQKGKWH